MFCIRYVGGVVPQKQVPSSEPLYHTALAVTRGAASGNAGEDGAAFGVQILLPLTSEKAVGLFTQLCI